MPSQTLRFLASAIALFIAGCARPPAPPEPEPPIDRVSWRKLNRSMTSDQVKNLLGAPKSEGALEDVVCWYYLGGQPLERHVVEADRWMIPRGAVLYSKRAGSLRVVDWRDP